MGQDDDAEEREPGEIEPREAGGEIERLVENDLIDDEPHEERLDHLQARDREGKDKDDAQLIPMGPQPAQVVPHVRAAWPPPGGAWLSDRLATVRLGYVIEAVLFVILNELLVALPGRTSGAHETT